MSIQISLANKKHKARRKIVAVSQEEIDQVKVPGFEPGEVLDSQFLLITALLPPAVKEFYRQMENEVQALCGKPYSRGDELHSRWAAQNGSIFLGGQKVAIEKPRVRFQNQEQKIPIYERFRDPELFDQRVFEEGLRRITQRDYEQGIPKIGASFGLSKSNVSRGWCRATKNQLEKLRTRDLRGYKICAVFIDGKRFAKLGAVVALGVGGDGRKHVLGIYESSTENSSACVSLLDDLQKRGLPEEGLVFIVDGGSGLNKALNEKYELQKPDATRAIRVRCFVHKWRNISDVLTEKQAEVAGPLFWAIREARDLTQAKECAASLEKVLEKFNASALFSFLEAREDLLNIHRLGLSNELRRFFSTTNPIESLNSLLEEDLRRVKRWQSSLHFQRWLATACLKNEKRMRRIRGYRGLPALKVKLQKLCKKENSIDEISTAA